MFRYFVDGTGVTVIKDTHTIFQDIFRFLKGERIFTAFYCLSQDRLGQISAESCGNGRAAITRSQQVDIGQKSKQTFYKWEVKKIVFLLSAILDAANDMRIPKRIYF